MNKSENVLGDEVGLDIIDNFNYGPFSTAGFVDSNYQTLNTTYDYFEMTVLLLEQLILIVLNTGIELWYMIYQINYKL